MTLPEPDEFPSQPTPADGRLYDVDGPYKLVAYVIEDSETFRHIGAEALILYTFIQRRQRKVGYWNWTIDPEDLVRVMRAFRDAGVPDRPPEDHRGPGGERPTIQPVFRRTFERAVEAATPAIHLDVEAIMEGTSGRSSERPLRLVPREER
ncbi:MAG: hypothetical protein ACREM1_22755, partial [Longimicrobiales bacterium]